MKNKIGDTGTNAVAMNQAKIDWAKYVTIDGNIINYYADVDQYSILLLKNAINSINKSLTAMKLEYTDDNFDPIMHLHINSYGGNLSDGMFMYDYIKNNKYKIYTHIDGMAASAASIIFMAGTKRYMTENSRILIHQLSHGGWDRYSFLQDSLESNKKYMQHLYDLYEQQITNMSRQQIIELMKHDLFLTKNEAVKYGMTKQ